MVTSPLAAPAVCRSQSVDAVNDPDHFGDGVLRRLSGVPAPHHDLPKVPVADVKMSNGPPTAVLSASHFQIGMPNVRELMLTESLVDDAPPDADVLDRFGKRTNLAVPKQCCHLNSSSHALR